MKLKRVTKRLAMALMAVIIMFTCVIATNINAEAASYKKSQAITVQTPDAWDYMFLTAKMKKATDIKVTFEILSVGKGATSAWLGTSGLDCYDKENVFDISFAGKELKKGAKKTVTVKKARFYTNDDGSCDFGAKIWYEGPVKVKVTVKAGSKIIGKITK